MLNLDASAFSYRLIINDHEFSDQEKLGIISIGFEERLQYTSKVEIVFRDHQDFALTLEDVSPESRLRLIVGWLNLTKEIFDGEIVGVEPRFTSGEAAALSVMAFDHGYRLKRFKELPAIYPRENILQAVEDTLKSYSRNPDNLSYEISPRKKLQEWQLTDDEIVFKLDDTTDYEFLSWIADRNDFILVVRGRTIYFVEREYFAQQTDVQKYNFYYRPTFFDEQDKSGMVLIEFSPRNRTTEQRDKVEVVAWNSVDPGGLIRGGRTLPELRGQVNYTTMVVRSTKTETFTVFGTAARNPAQVYILAQSELARRARKFVEGHGVIKGWPMLRLGQRHNFRLRAMRGIGESFSGEYFITGVEHRWDAKQGYRTAFDVSRDSLSVWV